MCIIHSYTHIHKLIQETLLLSSTLSYYLSFVFLEKNDKTNCLHVMLRLLRNIPKYFKVPFGKTTFQAHTQNWKCYLCLDLNSVYLNWNMPFLRSLLKYFLTATHNIVLILGMYYKILLHHYFLIFALLLRCSLSKAPYFPKWYRILSIFRKDIAIIIYCC